MEKYYDFNSKDIPEILEVGGKALSLIKLKKGGFNVPDGSVLTVDFFKGWIDELKLLPDLNSIAPNQSTFKVFADKLKSKAKGLIFSEEQKAVVRTVLNNYEKRELFAVRSSSPEEDLSGASFAGGYETILGVTNQNIYDAIKTAFVSCMDERVFVYKNQNGFDTKNIRIAVIIQEQIDSETSGVGFSLNPLTNCFDEVVIDANFGLGESVVSGIITPDEFVVDKNTKDIIEKKLGNKEQIIVLNSKGGTKTISGNREEFSMSEKQIGELLDLIIKVEKLFFKLNRLK